MRASTRWVVTDKNFEVRATLEEGPLTQHSEVSIERVALTPPVVSMCARARVRACARACVDGPTMRFSAMVRRARPHPIPPSRSLPPSRTDSGTPALAPAEAPHARARGVPFRQGICAAPFEPLPTETGLGDSWGFPEAPSFLGGGSQKGPKDWRSLKHFSFPRKHGPCRAPGTRLLSLLAWDPPLSLPCAALSTVDSRHSSRVAAVSVLTGAACGRGLADPRLTSPSSGGGAQERFEEVVL